MSVFLAFTVLLAALAVNATPIENEFEKNLEKERQLYPRFISMPDGDGNLHEIDLHAPVNYELVSEVARNPARVQYFLYTRHNRASPQNIYTHFDDSVIHSNFDANKHTVVIAHGFLNNRNSEPNPTVTAVYLNKHDVNVIVVDWGYLAMSVDYVSAAYGVPAVGRAVGQLVNWLHHRFGLAYGNVHLIGFSLGAHLVGNAGRETGGRVARVTGLDPAGPLWYFSGERLLPSDAIYTECIHTDGGYTVGGLGIGTNIADVDFFPNGGITQPGCLTNVCNHARAWELFAATVTHNHLQGNRCSNFAQISLNTCRGEGLRMGNDDLRKRGISGSYRVDTGRRYPF